MVHSDPTLRSANAKRAAHARAAKYGSAATKAARDAANHRFTVQARQLVGPDASEAEVARRAEHLFKAYMAELSYLSLKSRAEKRERRAKVAARSD